MDGFDDPFPLHPEDFDEDFSDCTSIDLCDADEGCEYDENDVCNRHGGFDDESDTSHDSDNSGGRDRYIYGMDYYDMEEKEREKMEKDRQNELELELYHVNLVKGAIVKAEKQEDKKKSPLLRLGGRTFRLWSLDHLKYCPSEAAPTLYIEFYSNDEFDFDKWDHPELKNNELSGHIYLVSDAVCHLDLFTPPKYPSTKTYQLRADNQQWTLAIQFIDDYHLTIKMSSRLVFCKGTYRMPGGLPSEFTCYGIRDSSPADRRREEGNKVRRRSASPE
jgi:hypothetical protein